MTTDEFDTYTVRILHRREDASVQANTPGADTLKHLPISRETFLDLMECFQLSPSFVRTVLRGKIHFSHTVTESVPAVGMLQRFSSSSTSRSSLDY